MEYAELEVTGSGLTLRWQISNVPAAQAFAERLAQMQTIPLEPNEPTPRPAIEAPLRVEPVSQTPAPSPPAGPAGPGQPGWFPDPMGVATWRWWDGRTWTERTNT
jgi:hypothetical protein